MNSFVYILHFNRPRAHAEHYSGSTRQLRQRLEAHANGAGSCLTRTLAREGEHWTVGGLYQATADAARKLERELKKQANAPRYCGLCTTTPLRLIGGSWIEPRLMPFPITSQELHREAIEQGRSFTIRQSTEADIERLSDAMKRMCRMEQQLGYIPISGIDGQTRYIAHGQVAYAEIAGLIVGYASWSRNTAKQCITVHQVCVVDECRLMGIGRALLASIFETHKTWEGRCSVRNDLPANEFWTSIGWTLHKTKRHATSGHMLNEYISAATPRPV